MLFLKLLVLAYLIVAILAVVMVVATISSKTFRAIFIILGLIAPAIFLYAGIASLFVRKPVPCFDRELAEVEDEIEAERIRIFGGERITPSFGKRWEAMYKAYVEQVAETTQSAQAKIISIADHFRPGFRKAA